MKIGIITAMVEELEPILARLSDVREERIAGNTYYTARYGAHELVLAYSKIGKIFSTMTTCMLIEHFGAQSVLFSGVAGSLREDLHIKDMIYASALCQHDLDITAFGHPHGFVPEGAVRVESDAALNALAMRVADDLGITLRAGTIATGDQFVCDEARKSWIAATFDADAVEMEGSSVAVVCDAMRVPFFVLRAISDNAGGGAEVDFDEFLRESAALSANFILEMVARIA